MGSSCLSRRVLRGPLTPKWLPRETTRRRVSANRGSHADVVQVGRLHAP
jgi:hypothetical protein